MSSGEDSVQTENRTPGQREAWRQKPHWVGPGSFGVNCVEEGGHLES